MRLGRLIGASFISAIAIGAAVPGFPGMSSAAQTPPGVQTPTFAARTELNDILDHLKPNNVGDIVKGNHVLRFVPVTFTVLPTHPGQPMPAPKATPASGGATSNITTSINWTGYEGWEPTGNWYGESELTWTVPSLTVNSGTPPRYSSQWPGIGAGHYASNELVQAGTEADSYGYSGTSYYWWWEIVPTYAYQVRVNTMPISPGQFVGSDVYYAPTPNGLRATFYLSNWSASKYTSFSVTLAAGQKSGGQAESITERTEVSGSYPPLSLFGTIRYTHMTWRTEGRYFCIGQLPNTRLTMLSLTETYTIAQSRWTDSGGCSFKSTRLPGT